MPHTAAEADRLARQAVFLGALAAIGALLLAVLGWAGGAVAMWMGVTARRRGAGRTAVVAIALGGLGLVAGVGNALLGAYLFR